MPRTPRRTLRASIALAATCATLAPATARAVMLLRGPMGPTDFGTRVLMFDDDGSSPSQSITPPLTSGIRVTGATRFSLYVNNNGNVTFDAPLMAYTPGAFPTGTSMIAAWWGDADTRGARLDSPAGVYVRRTSSEFIVTWYQVGYYSMHGDRLNSFQLVLRDTACPTCMPFDYEVEFRYEQCQWTAGDRSGGMGGMGGTAARAGFNYGGLSVELPGSGTSGVSALCTGSNVETPGLWVYCVRDSRPSLGPCMPFVVVDGGVFEDVPVVAVDSGRPDGNGLDASRPDADRADAHEAGQPDGVGPFDASAPDDAAVGPDAVVTTPDANGYRPPPVRFRGGGCACDAATTTRGAGSGASSALGAIACALLLTARARARRRRRRA